MNGIGDSHLSARRRERDLDLLAGGEIVDVLVVGGGITGAGVALDAAARGLSVALIERGDLAAGTSRWSSKLVHGGVRYLATGKVGVAAESVRERGILATNVAPHLIRPLPFVTAIGEHGVGAGMAAAVIAGYEGMDLLRRTVRTPGSLFPAPRMIDAETTQRLIPGIARDGLRSGVLNWDGQVEDDARLVIAVARTAASYGARILTRVEALEVGPGGARAVVLGAGGGSSPAGTGVGSMIDIRARNVVNATGVWADHLDPSVVLRPSRGTHLVVSASALGHPTAALGTPVPGHFGRVVFALPQAEGTVILGLTDVPAEEVSYSPQASSDEVDFLLDTFSEALARPLDRSDVLGVYSGLRPLLAAPEEGQETSDLSRRHSVIRHSGMITVTGGKLTTYRRMAADVVDLLTDRPCPTAELPLVGSAGKLPRPADPGMARPGSRSDAEVGGSSTELPARLVRRFGSEAADVAAMAEGDPALLAPIAPGVPALGVEVLWGMAAEGALTMDDVLDTRLRLDLVPAWRRAADEAARDLQPAT